MSLSIGNGAVVECRRLQAAASDLNQQVSARLKHEFELIVVGTEVV